LITSLSLGVMGPATAAEPTAPDAWTPLLTRDLRNFTTKGNWKVDDQGVLSIVPREGETGWKRFDAYLYTKEQYTHFRIALEFKLPARGNSGLFFRVQDMKSPVDKGMEVQILDRGGQGKKPSDKPLSHHDMGGIIKVKGATKYTLNKPGEWNAMVVTAVGQRVTVEVNGEVVNRVDLSKTARKDHPLTGHLALQDHGGPAWFRNVRVQVLNDKGEIDSAGKDAATEWTPPDDSWVSLFNGKDLSGWVTPKAEHTWQVKDGVIDYEAKGGNLVTEKRYRNYKLHIEWRFKRTAGKGYTATLCDADGEPIAGPDGKPKTVTFPNADSGIFLRGTGMTQVNLWCWPCGSGQMWSFRNHKDPEVRKGAWPDKNADKPVGEWNVFDITLVGETVTIVNNGVTVARKARMPGIPAEGPIALQHHGGKKKGKDEWSSASALIQFRRIWIKELP